MKGGLTNRCQLVYSPSGMFSLKNSSSGMSAERRRAGTSSPRTTALKRSSRASLACSAETQTQIDHQVVALVKKEHAKAVGILTENRAKLDELAKYLYEKETITGEEFMAILNRA